MIEQDVDSLMANSTRVAYRVFLCHVRDDGLSVRRLAAALEAAGVEVWRDTEGSRVSQRLNDHIEDGQAFIACFSREALARPDAYMYKELEIAIGCYGRRPRDRQWLIPVVLDDSELPSIAIGPNEFLSDLQQVRLGADWEGGIAQLLRVLHQTTPARSASGGTSLLRQIIQSCSEETAAGTEESVQSCPERATDAHVAAYLAAHNIPEHEPLEAYGLLPLGMADSGEAHKPPPRVRHSTGHSSNAPVFKAWRLAKWVPFLVTGAAVAALIAPIIFTDRVDTERQTQMAFCAPLGNHRTDTLPDGSTIDVNSGTCVSVMMSAKARTLRLGLGEAVIQVTPERDRPFFVEVRDLGIRVLGTRFDVYAGGQSTRISVSDGSVQVTPHDGSVQDPIHLAAGEQIEIPTDLTQVVVYRRHLLNGDFARLTAWQQGNIEFENQPLREIVREFGRYQYVQVDSKDPEILNRRFSGVFHTNDVDSFLKLLSTQCIQSKRENGGRRIVLSRCREVR